MNAFNSIDAEPSRYHLLLHHAGDENAHSRLILYDTQDERAVEAIDFYAPRFGDIRRLALDNHSIHYDNLKDFKVHPERTQCYAIGDSTSIGSIWARMKFAAKKLDSLYLPFSFAADLTSKGRRRFNCRSGVLAILYDAFKGAVYKNELTQKLPGSDVDFGEEANIDLSNPLAILTEHPLSHDMSEQDERRLRPYDSELKILL